MNFVGSLATGNPSPSKDNVINTKLDNITIDTCLPKDTDIWETGIDRELIEGKWVIVEQYKDREHAEKGHKKWEKVMTEEPDFPLKDIDQWSLDQLKGG